MGLGYWEAGAEEYLGKSTREAVISRLYSTLLHSTLLTYLLGPIFV